MNPIDVRCDHCGAQPGSPCHGAHGNRLDWFHGTRGTQARFLEHQATVTETVDLVLNALDTYKPDGVRIFMNRHNRILNGTPIDLIAAGDGARVKDLLDQLAGGVA